MKALIKQAIPHIIALSIFIVLPCIYFFPQLEGKVIKQGDIIRVKGMAKEASDFRNFTGEEALWSNNMFGGMPLYLHSAKPANDVLKHIYSITKLGFAYPIGIFVIYMFCFYLLMNSLRVTSWLSIVGSIAYAFSSYFIIIVEAGHTSKGAALAFAPAVLAGFIWVLRSRYLIGGAVFALFLALEIYMNHLQITYYLAMTIACIGVFMGVDLIKKKKFVHLGKSTVILLVGAGLALACTANRLLPIQEYSNYSTRGASELTVNPDGSSNEDEVTSGLDKTYATAWSYGKGETFTLLIPNAKGGATGAIGSNPENLDGVNNRFKQNIAQSNHYWGNQRFTSGPVYAGAIVCLLFLLGLFFLKSSIRWGLLSALILSILLAWGRNFMPLTEFFLDYFPGYNKFRTVSMILVIAQMVLPIGALLFVNELIKNPDIIHKNLKRFYAVSGSLIGLVILFWLMPTTFFDFISHQEQSSFGAQQGQQVQAFIETLEEVRVSIFKADALRTLLLLIIGAGLIWFYAQKRFAVKYLALILGVLVLGDLWTVNKRYLSNEKSRGKYEQWMNPEELNKPNLAADYDNQILQIEASQNPKIQSILKQRTDSLRKAQKKITKRDLESLQFGVLNQNTHYRVLNLQTGYFADGVTPYFHKSVGGYHGAKMGRYQELGEFHLGQGVKQLNMKVLNMLNTKYIIQNNQPRTNPSALGNAWFIQTIDVVDNANEEIMALYDFEPAQTAVLDKRFEDVVSNTSYSVDSAASIVLKSYSPKNMVYEYENSADGFAVFSEIYYPKGWNAYLDGNLVDHVRVNYVLRGMPLPKGKHELVFKFEPSSYALGGTITLASSIILILIVLLAIGYELKKTLSVTNE